MRVLFHLRQDWREHRGGDVVQTLRWASWLQELGVKVAVSSDTKPNVRGTDLAILTNLTRAAELLPTLRHLHQRGSAVLLCPLYWPTDEFETHGRPGVIGKTFGQLPSGVRERVKSAVRWVRRPAATHWFAEMVQGGGRFAKELVQSCDGLIVTSRAEARACRRDFGSRLPIHLTHIGVDAIYHSDDAEEQHIDARFLPATPAADTDATIQEILRREDREGILCVARFDPQKGQHRLIQALKGIDEELLLVGPDNPNYPGYREQCQKLAKGRNVRILDGQPPAVLKELYARCKVHALVSWYETAGLTGLEAACQGAKVVVTNRGGTFDYYKDLAWQADPRDLKSIRSAVEAALEFPVAPPLDERVRRHFTWQRSAEKLVRVCRQALAGCDARLAA